MLLISTLAHAQNISAHVSPETTLTIGDPIIQQALILSGEIRKLPFKVVWANISGGPLTIQAFRGHALDLGSVADIPPIWANWTGVPVKIVAVRMRQDPLQHPAFTIGIAPGAPIKSLADLRGKRIAYSPGQAQGALVLRILQKEGLSTRDVHLVELPSTTDVYAHALAGKLVDAAPLIVIYSRRYLAQYGHDGAQLLAHGLRDDITYLYAPNEVLKDPAKAAAVREYLKFWAAAVRWIASHQEEWIKGYYIDNQGLSPADARFAAVEEGQPDIPGSWNGVMTLQQATIDLLAAQDHQPRLNASDLFDRRFETVAASEAH